MKKFILSVYQIKSLRDSKLYIGSTSQGIKRLKSHFRELRKGKHKNSHLQDAYNLYGKDNFEHSFLEEQVKEFVTKQEAKIFIESREQYYLDTLLFASENDNRFWELGYNFRRKAESNLGMEFEESKKKNMGRKKGFKQPRELVEQLKKNNTGLKRTDETRKRMSEATKGKKKSESHVLNMIASRWGNNKEKYQKDMAAKMGKPVMQFDLLGIFVAEYNSKNDCIRKTGITAVFESCSGNHTKAGGFVFLFKEDYEKMTKEQFEHRIRLANEINRGGSGAKIVEQLDESTYEVLREFKSSNEAGRAMGAVTGSNIGSVCNGKLKTAYGYKWRYKI